MSNRKLLKKKCSVVFVVKGLICGASGMSFAAAAAAAAAANGNPLLGSVSTGVGPIQSATLASLVAGKSSFLN